MGWVSALISQRTFRIWGLATVLVVAMAAIAGGIAFGTTTGPNACTNTATLDGSAFEIDANANQVVNSTNCIDWLTASGATIKADSASGSGDESFGEGTKEDTALPTVVSGSIPPNKSDLKAFGVYTESGQVRTGNPTGKFLELLWTRVQDPSGTTNMDFELNQKRCGSGPAFTNCAPNHITPLRTTGDKLITYDLSRGGTVATISIRTWNGSAWGSPTVLTGTSAQARGTVNTTQITAANSLASLSPPLDPRTFGEASISFGALFGTNTCGSFGSAYLKSRSSDSFTAALKDFVPPEAVSISNCAALTTNATQSATVGSPISDTATLSGVTPGAGGTITFKAFGPNDANCSGTAAFTSQPITVNGPGDYGSGNFTPTAVGTYRWTASYTGDANNQAASSPCNAANESSTVNPASPSISTTLSDEEITVGGTIHDSATLTDATPDAGGTVTYTAYTNDTCTEGARDAGTKTVTNGSVPDSDPLTFNAAGDYYWQAVYSGDDNNGQATSVCTSEHLVVGKAPSTLNTAQSFYPNDEVTLSATSGGTPTGDVTFSLFDNSNCTGTPLFTPVTDTLDADGKASTNNTTFKISSSKTVYWKVEYPGDAKHNSVDSCTENTVLTIDNGGPVTGS